MMFNLFGSIGTLFVCFGFITSTNTGTRIKNSLRVVGGRLATKNEFPYVVRIDLQSNKYAENQNFESYRRFCTGSALTSSWTLTAAHCMPLTKEFSRMYIRFNYFLPEIKGDVVRVLARYPHPSYVDLRQKRYDIGLLQTENVKIFRYAQISALDYTTLIGQQATAIGHGMTNISGSPEPLQVLKGMLSKCTHDSKYNIGKSLDLCIKSSCGVQASNTKGDSGGPVLHSSGIVAVNSMSAIMYNSEMVKLRPLYYKPSSAVVTCVSPVIDWIVNHIINNKTG